MTGLLLRPADVFDMAEMAARAPFATRLQWAVAREMLSGGDAFALIWRGRLIGVAGLYPAPDGGSEAWFEIDAAEGRAMLAVVRAIRLTCAQAKYGAIVTICTTAAGKRIARAAGFTFEASTDIGEIWSCPAFSETPQRSRWSSSSANRSPTLPASRAKPTRRAQRADAASADVS